MKIGSLFLRYIGWHYSRALIEFWQNVKTLFWFAGHFFSIEILLKTFFQPWKRLNEEKGSAAGGLEDWFGRFVINTLMRFIGIVCRSSILFMAVISFLILAVSSVGLFLVWLALPFLILMLLAKAIALIIP